MKKTTSHFCLTFFEKRSRYNEKYLFRNFRTVPYESKEHINNTK